MRKLICRIQGIYHFITMITILFSKCTGQIFRVSFRVGETGIIRIFNTETNKEDITTDIYGTMDNKKYYLSKGVIGSQLFSKRVKMFCNYNKDIRAEDIESFKLDKAENSIPSNNQLRSKSVSKSASKKKTIPILLSHRSRSRANATKSHIKSPLESIKQVISQRRLLSNNSYQKTVRKVNIKMLNLRQLNKHSEQNADVKSSYRSTNDNDNSDGRNDTS